MRKIKFKKFTSVVLALCLSTALLAGCGGGKDKNDGGSGELSEFVYVPEFVTIDADIQDAQNIHMIGDRIYFTQYKQISGPKIDKATAYDNQTEDMMEKNQIFAADGSVINAEDVKNGTTLCSVKTDGSDYKETKNYKPVEIKDSTPEREVSSGNIDQYVIDEDGNFTVCEDVYVSIFDLPDGFDESQGNKYDYYVDDETHIFVRKLDKTGKEMSSVDLYETLKSENDGDSHIYISDMAIDKDGNVCVNAGDKGVFLFTKDGEYKDKISTDSWVDTIFADKDGNVLVSTSGEEGIALQKVDVEKAELTDKTSIPDNLYSLMAGSGEYEYLSNDGSSLFGFNSGDEQATEILNWLNADVDSNQIEDVKFLNDGRILALLNNNNEIMFDAGMNGGGVAMEDSSDEPALSLVYLTKTPRSEVKQKTTLKLACMNLGSSLRREIMNFNKKSETTRIEVEDYSKYSTQEDWDAGLTKLNTEIISGNIPDIISLSQMSCDQYVAKGILEDLYPYIDKDEELSREDFIPSLLKAQEIDGKLYQAASDCSISTMVASEDIVGKEMGWTMPEMLEILKKYPDVKYPFGYYMTRDTIMQFVFAMQLSDYVDWTTGECDFENDNFKGLLEFAKTFPKEYPDQEDGEYHDDSEMIMNGEQLFQITQISDAWQAQQCKSIYHDTYVYKGIPCSDKSGNIAMFNSPIAISTSCKDKDAAWQLVREVLTKDYQQKNSWSLATRQDILHKMVKDVLEEAKNEGISKMGVGNTEIEMKPLEQKDIDKYTDAIDSVTKSFQYDEEINNIVSEEAEAFFNGQKNLDDVASMIQSRVSLYVNEQK